MSPATEGFSVIMRDLDMGAGNRTQLRDFCKWETLFRHAPLGDPASRYTHPSFTKYFPGNCLTKRFNSNCSRVDETGALGRRVFSVISSIDVSVASMESEMRRSSS